MNPNLVIIDQYDDPTGSMFKTVFPDIDLIPGIIKTARALSAEDIETLSDDNFALIALDGGYKLKKFATVDRGNTVLSTFYFLQNKDKLSEDAVKIAALNLRDACIRNSIPIPAEIEKIAGEANMPGNIFREDTTKKNSSSRVEKELGRDTEDQDFRTRVNINSPQGNNFLKMPIILPEKEFEKEKMASKYIDISDLFSNKRANRMTIEDTYTLLDGKYPVNTFEQAEIAKDYFVEYKDEFSPEQKHEYCVKLASRLNQFGLPVSEEIERYGSETYSADSDIYLEARKSLVSEEASLVLDTLLEKRAMVSPETFASALEAFDVETGLNALWGERVPDPYYSTFGPSLEKLASDDWKFLAKDGFTIREEDLVNLAKNNRSIVIKAFGENFADKFGNSPKSVFKGLPEANKLIIARLARCEEKGNV